jgi:cobaltochelatase CobN
MPEMDAVIEPITIAGRTEKGTFDPLSSQIEWLADRTIAWAELGRKPNPEKKAAIIYYNHGGGKDNLGATYINVPRSLQVILDGLNESGYRVEGTVPDERDLVDLMAHEGTNIGTWAPGELERMVEAGNATLIPVDDYLEWFSEIDPAKQREVTERWGPAPGEIMVYENETGRYFVIPKLSFGNVILAPQPTRGWLQNNTALYHNKDIPPHHQYIAFYLWLRKGFDADFIVHLGKHGTQEWTPGKESRISGEECRPGILLIQDLPVIYPYIADNIAEASQAKRRGGAVMIPT